LQNENLEHQDKVEGRSPGITFAFLVAEFIERGPKVFEVDDAIYFGKSMIVSFNLIVSQLNIEKARLMHDGTR